MSPLRGASPALEGRAVAAGRLSKVAMSLSTRSFPAVFVSHIVSISKATLTGVRDQLLETARGASKAETAIRRLERIAKGIEFIVDGISSDSLKLAL